MNTRSARLIEYKSTLFLLMFLALGAIAFSIRQGRSFFASRIEQRALTDLLAQERIETIAEIGQQFFSDASIALTILGSTRELYEISQGREIFDSDPELLFRETMQAVSTIFQLRYIDGTGQERLRFDRYSDEIVLMPEEDLQYKGDRDYFFEAMRQPTGTLYVSDFDLNVENGEVEIPWKPTVRVAIPIAANAEAVDGRQPTGLLIMNLSLQDLFNSFDTACPVTKGELYLVNNEGYWLYGKELQNSWAFMFNRETGFFSEFPDVWEQMEGTPEGRFQIEEENWSFVRFSVQDLFPKSLAYSLPDKVLASVIVRYPNDRRLLRFSDLLAPLLVIGLLALLSLGWTLAVQKQRRAEGHLANSRKLASLARLVAGVAHELNTPIGSAVTVSSTLREWTDDMKRKIEDGRIRKSEMLYYINSVNDAARLLGISLNRAAGLVRSFKEVSVDQSGDRRRSFELDEYINEVALTMAHLFNGRRITLRLDLQSRVVMDSYPGSISQVVINIVQNALIHGFEQDEPGRIAVRTRSRKSGFVRIEIEDDGRGIPNENIGKLFEPFYTTRLGQGSSGLGLHIVHNAVTKVLGGTLTVWSRQDEHRTVFTMVLPLSAPNIELKEILYNEK